MSKYELVKGYPNLVRDPETNAILNIDVQAIELARAGKLARKQKNQNMEQRMHKIENDLGDIKEALNALIQKL